MKELEQVTCCKCGEAFTRVPPEPGWTEFAGIVCPACKPPPDPNAPLRFTLSQRLVVDELAFRRKALTHG